MAWLKDVMEGRRPKDLYEVLGCAPSSTQEQIKVEYKMRVLDCHPDRHPDDSAARTLFHELTEAFSILGDPAERKIYDEWKASGLLVPYALWRKEQNEKHPTQHWRSDHGAPTLLNHPSAPPAAAPAPPHSAAAKKSLAEQFRDYDI